jgi:hypothetical protein
MRYIVTWRSVSYCCACFYQATGLHGPRAPPTNPSVAVGSNEQQRYSLPITHAILQFIFGVKLLHDFD